MTKPTTQAHAGDKPAITGEATIVVAEKREFAPPKGASIGSRSLLSLADFERATLHYPETIRGEVSWLQGFYLDYCKGNKSTLRALSAQLKMEKSEAYFGNLMQGYNFTERYPSGNWKPGGKAWAECMELLAALRRYAQQIEQVGRLPFVPTPTYHCIANFITARMALSAVCKFGGLTGPTGGQKSACLKQYRLLNNHGRVIHVEAPANGRLSALQLKIAAAYHVNKTGIRHRREDAIREQVNETRCIIIDNSQVLYLPSRGGDQPAFNWLRELQDDTNCTIILSFTTDFVDELTGKNARGYFEQFVGRMGGIDSILRLPDYTPNADLRVIARSFGLDAGKGAMDWLSKWSRRDGRVRIVFDKLQLAREFARADGRDRITLADMEEADAFRPQAIGSDDEGGAL